MTSYKGEHSTYELLYTPSNPYVLDSSRESGLTQSLDAQSLNLRAESSKLEDQS